MLKEWRQKLLENRFLLEELTKRDFKRKYKRTVFGMLWSVISPLLTLLVMRMVFTQFFGRHTPFYTTYIFAGNLVYSYFNEATTMGMGALDGNKQIFSKVNVPKYAFVFSSNVSSFVNFLLSLVVFFFFALLDGIAFQWNFFLLLYPIACLLMFNLGMSMILSALSLFFVDIRYIYRVFTLLLMYCSAIFYTVDKYPMSVQNLFLVNPIYVYIRFFRAVVIDQVPPTATLYLLCIGYAVLFFTIGALIYKKNNQRFMYYV